MTEAETKIYSVLLYWNPHDPDEGTYAWAGRASENEDPIEKARRQAVIDSECDVTDEEWENGDWEHHAPSTITADYAVGVNIWAANDLLASLKELAGWMREHTSPTDENSPHEMLVRAVAAIARAECLEQDPDSNDASRQ